MAGSIWTAVHQFPIDGLGAGGVGEQFELVEAALGLEAGHTGKLDADQKGALNPDLEVGDGCGQPAAAAGGAIVSH